MARQGDPEGLVPAAEASAEMIVSGEEMQRELIHVAEVNGRWDARQGNKRRAQALFVDPGAVVSYDWGYDQEEARRKAAAQGDGDPGDENDHVPPNQRGADAAKGLIALSPEQQAALAMQTWDGRPNTPDAFRAEIDALRERLNVEERARRDLKEAFDTFRDGCVEDGKKAWAEINSLSGGYEALARVSEQEDKELAAKVDRILVRVRRVARVADALWEGHSGAEEKLRDCDDNLLYEGS